MRRKEVRKTRPTAPSTVHPSTTNEQKNRPATGKVSDSYRLDVPLVCLGLVFLTFVAFGDLLSKDFEFFNVDDDEYVTHNVHVQAGLTWDSLRWAFTAFHSNNWHPVTWLSLQVDHVLHGLDPAGYRFTNVLLHAANAVLLFLVLWRMTAEVWRSAFVAALFALHPMHVESVAWISERKDVLSTLFWLLTTAAYVWYCRKPELRRYLLVFVLFTLGMMAKQMLVTLPCVLLLLDFWPLRRLWRRAEEASPFVPATLGRLMLEKLPLLAVAFAVAMLTVQAQQQMRQSLDYYPVSERLTNALVAYVRYVVHALYPINLVEFYPHPRNQLPAWQWLAAGLSLLVATALVLRFGKERKYLPVGWFWYLGTLVPVIGLVQVGQQALADRYSYVPLIGLFILIAWLIPDVATRLRMPNWLLPTMAGLLLFLCLLGTWRQVRFWQSSLIMWERIVSFYPESPNARMTLGGVHYLAGRYEEAIPQLEAAIAAEAKYFLAHHYLGLSRLQHGDSARAVEALEQAVALNPTAAQPRTDLGRGYLALGRAKEARDALTQSLQFDSSLAMTHHYLGQAQLQLGELAEARQHAQKAIQLAPTVAMPVALLGWVLAVEGKPAEALQSFNEALKLDTQLGDALYGRAWALAATGKATEAKEQYRRAVELRSVWPITTMEEAWRLATDPQAERRAGKLALVRAEAASAATNDTDPRGLDVLAAAQAELGQFEQAVVTAKKARELAQAKGQSELRDKIDQRSRSYEAKQPWRDGIILK